MSIKILGFLYYILNKDIYKKDLFNKAKKGILVGFKSNNIYLVYIPKENKVVNIRDIVIYWIIRTIFIL